MRHNRVATTLCSVQAPQRHVLLASLLLFASTFFSITQALALPTVIYDPLAATVATGVRGLEVDTMTLDVEFIDGSYREVYGERGAFFLNNPSLALWQAWL